MEEKYEVKSSEKSNVLALIMTIIAVVFITGITVEMFRHNTDFPLLIFNYVMAVLGIVLYYVLFTFIKNIILKKQGYGDKIVINGDDITINIGKKSKYYHFRDIQKVDFSNKAPIGSYTDVLYICFSKYEYYPICKDDTNVDRLLERLERMGFVKKTEYFYEPAKYEKHRR